ncbi:hypothetical protein A9Q88_02210 [Gammaproteobacteria bacterium 50_400_T64]|nr:hypothetical protein A9Q88_02210 [Gammaproteobacteria bacterium 50_400_T64]
MALRKSSVLTGLVALGFSCWVSALGLGELTLHSALDEPFDAEIELVNVGEADENQILVGLASKADFERAGVTWEFHLLNLNFKTDLSDIDHPIVKVTSKDSIREPYLDFVAQLQWPSGLLLREYTLFLDLPVFDTQKVSAKVEAAVASPVARSSSVQRKQVPAGEKDAIASVSPVSSSTGATDYRVKGGDTLWTIASQAELGNTTVQQRMVAIQAANANAFSNGNANLLKKGAVLRIPDLANVESINLLEANQVVAKQARAWNEQHKKSAVRELIGDVPGAEKNKAPVEKEGLLRLSTPTESSSADGQQLGRTSSGEGSSASSEVLQNELGIAHEELERSKRENLELKEKLASLEAQLNTTELIKLESDELKAVQLSVAAEKAASEASAEMDATTEVNDVTEVDKAETAVVDAAAVSDSGGTGNEGADTKSLEKGSLGGLFAFLESNWIPLLGFIAVLLGVLFLVAKSKKDDEPEFIEPSLNIGTDTAKNKKESDATDGTSKEEPPVQLEPAMPEPVMEVAPEAEIVELVDPIAEADIYSSLGNFSEAESVIKKAIEASPNDSQLHLKRLDLFVAQEDAVGFDAYYPTLVALGDSDATATADRLRGNIPEQEVIEEPSELTLEQQVAEELGIADLELDLSGSGESKNEPVDELGDVLGDDILSADLATELDDSFIDSSDDLDLSGIELDLKPSASKVESTCEESDGDLEESMFGDIALPDELDDLSADFASEETMADLEIELPDTVDDGFDLQNAELESVDEGLELSLDSLDFDSDDIDAVEQDESTTQLELAQAYIEMSDESGAKDILAEVLNNGSDEQKQKANELLAKLS